ncbi:hypothetical protein T02_10591 [Trichinella nativa]|uniref:Uncharacterized protein n=1 Tax=Trichinella nativa TaxID=6335 RepID=A0A0V1L381_9BILA|nr:hypothetical protein T02_10591 [Trichinella nativa]
MRKSTRRDRDRIVVSAVHALSKKKCEPKRRASSPQQGFSSQRCSWAVWTVQGEPGRWKKWPSPQ